MLLNNNIDYYLVSNKTSELLESLILVNEYFIFGYMNFVGNKYPPVEG